MLATWCAFRLATSQVWGGFTYIVANWVDGADVGKTMGILAVAWELGTGGAEAGLTGARPRARNLLGCARI